MISPCGAQGPMIPYYNDGQAQLYAGDAREVLRTLPPHSVHCCVTSPPYFGLRDYGIAPSTWADGWRGVLGLEPDVQCYVAHLVEVLREVRRVLRPDGSLWLNLGDSYAGSGGAHAPEHANPGISRSQQRDGVVGRSYKGRHGPDPKRGDDSGIPEDQPSRYALPSLKALDLIGVPWRAALALQEEGWYLRCDVVWSKPNPLPESVAGWRWERCRVTVARARRGQEAYRRATAHAGPDHSGDAISTAQWTGCPGCAKCEATDGLVLRRGSWRPTRSHEYIFLLAKSDRYYGDGTDIREALASGESDLKKMREAKDRLFSRYAAAEDPFLSGGAGRIGQKRAVGDPEAGRNARSVWEFATQPFRGAHFATYPQELVRRCILAGTPDGGCCQECGAPWARVVTTTPMVIARSGRAPAGNHDRTVTSGTMVRPPLSRTLGWRPTCAHSGEPIPPVVLDPFAGSGTTLLVAKRLGRRSIGIDLNPAYLDMASERLRQLALLAGEEARV